jgi:hypothetical protein
MKKRFLLSPEAAQDITNIWEFLAEESIEAAHRVQKEIYDAISRPGNDARQRARARGPDGQAGALLAGAVLPDCVSPGNQSTPDCWSASRGKRYSCGAQEEISIC